MRSPGPDDEPQASDTLAFLGISLFAIALLAWAYFATAGSFQ